MERLLVLNLGNGNSNVGLPSVIAQLWEDGSAQPMQVSGSLPPLPELATLQQQWQTLYFALYGHLGWRRSPEPKLRSALSEFEIEDSTVTHISQAEFETVCQKLQVQLNQWLNSDGFQQIQRRIRTNLSPEDEIRVVITANDLALLQLPWHLWQLLEDYPYAEISLSPVEYARSRQTTNLPQAQVKILAILGNSQGIDVDYDRRILAELPQSHIQWLIEPNSEALQQQLWDQSWDVLFFAGHSSSQGKGCIQINATDRLTIDQLKYGLRRAIAKGLKLAIFNSCDGLGLAQDLADLRIPQVIVMRQPVPDRVAQAFLTTFLQTFSSGRSLYFSVREAREKLQLLERDFPCATWLPVICQNPAEPAARWSDWCLQESSGLDNSSTGWANNQTQKSWQTQTSWQTQKSWQSVRQSMVRLLACSLVSTGLVTGAKSLGLLESIELAAYDQLMRMKPLESHDSRLLIIALTEEDIQNQPGQATRAGSLSDESLDQLLKILEKAKPRAIGLDLYRDFPATLPSLKNQLQNNDRLFTICKRPYGNIDPTGVLPAPEIPDGLVGDIVGFNDVIRDADGVVRRHLMAVNPQSTSRCNSGFALSTLLALSYLAEKNINSQFIQNKLQIGQRQIPGLGRDAGGYHSQSNGQGLQIMLNYRRSEQGIAQTITLQQALSNQIPLATFRDRIVLIGGVNFSGNDFWATPFGSGFPHKQPGVFIHAHMTSQILSAVLDKRPLIYPVSWPNMMIYSFFGAMVGGVIGFLRPRYFLIVLVIVMGVMWAIAAWGLTQGWWIPVGIQFLALTGTSLLVITSMYYGRQNGLASN